MRIGAPNDDPGSSSSGVPRRRAVLAAVVVVAVLASVVITFGAGLPVSPPRARTAPFTPSFRTNGFVTNEYARSNASHPDAVRSPDWIVTSGSLFARDGAAWSGRIDDARPNARSSNGTGSAVFRTVSRRSDFGDTKVETELLVVGQTTTRRTPAQAWDGVHFFVRYSDPQNLYAVSAFRRDGSVVVKRKALAAGGTGRGTYTTLASGRGVVTPGRWHRVVVTTRAVTGGIALSLTIDGRVALSVVDHRPALPPTVGRIGVRGDNTEFQLRGFTAAPMS